MINIYAIRIKHELNKDIFNTLQGNVSDEKKQRIQRFKFYADAQRSLFGELLAIYAIKQRFNLDYSTKKFSTTEYGKPYVADQPNIHFNITHSGDWVLCAISDSKVGIDVEETKPIDLRIGKRFFSEAEYQELLKCNEQEQQDYFYKIWTLKESYIKSVGKGLEIPLNSFSMSINDKITFSSEVDKQQYFFDQFYIDKNHIVAVCSSDPKSDYKLQILELNELVY